MRDDDSDEEYQPFKDLEEDNGAVWDEDENIRSAPLNDSVESEELEADQEDPSAPKVS